MQLKTSLLVAACTLAATSAAQAQIYKAALLGSNENPPVVTTGNGTVVVTLNTTSRELRVKANFSGLTGNTTAAHIHCCAAPTANAGVVTATPSFPGFPNGVREANFDATYNTTLATTWNASAITANGGTPAGAEAALATGMAAGSAYFNLHTAAFPGGEIRGNLQRFSFVPAATPLTASVAGALDSLGAGTGAINERLVNLAMATPAQQASAMVSLLPASSLATATVAGNGLFSDYDQISNRLGGLRMSDGRGAWGKLASRNSEHKLANRGAGVDSDGWDVIGGYDMSLGQSSRVGVAVAYAEDSLEYTGAMQGSGTDLEGWRATVYGEHRIGSAFIEGMLTTGRYDIDGIRDAGAGGLAMSSTEADMSGGRIAAGFDIQWKAGSVSAQFTPQVRLDWSSFDADGYSETSTGAMALAVRSRSDDRQRFSIGGQFDLTTLDTIRPYVRAFWSNEMEDDDSATAASFVAGGSAFTAVDEGLESNGFTVGIGVNVVSSERLSAAVGYDRVDGRNVVNHNFHARGLWRF